MNQETMAPSFVPLLPSNTVVYPSQNTPTRLPSRSDPVSEPVCRTSDVPIDESSEAPGSMQVSPRDLTRSQGELFRSSLEHPNPTTVSRRNVGKRTVILPELLALSDNVDWGSVPDSFSEAGMPEALEPSESDTKKRRVESFDESMERSQRERSSIAWLTNSSGEREIFEIDVGEPPESEKSFLSSFIGVVVKEIVRWEID